MIGRQSVLATADAIASSCELFKRPLGRADAQKLIDDSDGFAEAFFKFLGAIKVESFDASEYEGASVVHDFNRPVLEEWKARFSAVLDGGSLEHIFNFPVALKSGMEMVRVGGHYLAITPTNNFSGHGFYQFSPELLYRVFNEANGFELKKMMIHETAFDGEWFDVADPEDIRERVTLLNSEPAHLLLIAQRVSEQPILATPPQQSDYVTAWSAGSSKSGYGSLTFSEKAWKKIQRFANRRLGELYTRKKLFKRIDLP